MQTILLIFLLVSFAIFLLPNWLKKNVALLLSAVEFGFFAYFFSKIETVANGNSIVELLQWVPQLGLSFELVLNGLSLAFALLITGIGGLVFLYAHAYMKSYERTTIFYFYLFMFSGAMLGLVLSGNLIQLFVFWELTSFLSFLLISFFHEKVASRNAAFQSLVVTGFGGLVLLSGIVLLGGIVDSYSVADWVINSDTIKQSHLYLPGLLLIFVGVFSKSAQFPFHFWLPGAMQAPTPVSSYLHSATMVKAGVFLLALLNPVLGGTPEWTYILTLIGVITMFLGAYFSITQTDIKAILAYTTISALGILVLLLGIDTTLSVKAAMLFLFVHAFYKAALFMIAGFIDKKTGTRDLAKLGGLFRLMPITTIVAFLALLSMAGLPPMLGFLGKELIYEAKVQSPGIASLVLILGVGGNMLMVAVSMYFLVKVFFGKKGDWPKIPSEKGWGFLAGPTVLVLMSLIFGLFPGILGNTVIEPALNSIRKVAIDVDLKLWHGFNKVLLLSFMTVTFGFALFFIAIRNKQFLEKWRAINQQILIFRFTDAFNKGLNGFLELSKRKTSVVQHGYHRYYILSVVVFSTVFLWYQVFVTWGWQIETTFTLDPFYISGLVVIIIFSAIYSAVSASRITTIITMGTTGYGIALIYLYYSAVDLAITQIIVETLIVIMFVLILQRLPLFAKLSSKQTKIRDLSIALAFGSVMTVLALKAINVDFDHNITNYIIQNSYIKAYGKNVVNVILVDFRALDTLGEVTVLVVAAIGVFVLLKTKKA